MPGSVSSMMNGAASMRKPATPSWSQNADDLLDLRRAPPGWRCSGPAGSRRSGGSTRPGGPVVASRSRPARPGRPCPGAGPPAPPPTRQTSRGTASRATIARRRNHGCSSDVWLTTRSMMTLMPRLSRLVQQLGEVAEGAQPRVDAVEVGDVVAVVAARRGVDRVQPQAGHAEPGQVVQPADEAPDVADAVAVGVGERVDVEAVDDGLLVPPLAHHVGCFRPRRRAKLARLGSSVPASSCVRRPG